MTPPAPLILPGPDETLAWLESRTADGLAEARRLVEGLRSAPPTEALDVLRRWDEVNLAVGNVGATGSLFAAVHPEREVRTAAEQAQVAVDKLSTELRQDRELYDLLSGLDRSGLDPAAARMLDKTLEEFQRAGVDRDDETRARLAAVRERITVVDQDFERTIREDVRTVRITPERLDGMPQDWLDAHPADAEGLVAVTTEYPDAVPVLMFAHDADVRRQVVTAFLDRAWPDNEPRLHELFDLRHEAAALLGFADWASYDAAVKMIGEGPAIPAFVDRIAAAATAPMERDLAILLDRLRQDRPDADGIDRADAAYYEEVVRRERHDVDSHRVRSYFAFDKVRQGLLEVTGRLFGLRYEPVTGVTAWHDEVTAYDVFLDPAGVDAGGDPLGRIFLDLHPREGKYTHAAQFTLARGVAGRQLPEGVLVCNFGRGLMEHSQVVTLFHEFGHLLHHVLGGHVAWFRFAGVATEWDFVEAPSQMLEEWAWDAEVLASFATDDDGRPIPSALVERMRAAHEFGKGTQARQQMFYAAMSYRFHTDRPADLTAAMLEVTGRYSPWRHLEGTHQFASFGHLGGYSSAYYTYAWSLVIAKDLFSAFGTGGLLAPANLEVARRYRDTILAAGGSHDAAELVEAFLGRPYSFDAYAAWLARSS